MIHAEAWFLTAGVQEDRDRLHAAFERGLISPEDFSRQVHLLWQRERGKDPDPNFKLLDLDGLGRPVITSRWVEDNEPVLRAFISAWVRFFRNVGGGSRYVEPSHPVGRAFLEFYETSVSKADRVFKVARAGSNSFTPVILVFPYAPFDRIWSGRQNTAFNLVGRMAKKWAGGKLVPVTSDADFQQYIEKVTSVITACTDAATRVDNAPRT